MNAPGYVAGFDSASAMLRALGRYLHGKAFPLLGTRPASLLPAMAPLAAAVNALPPGLREAVYIWSGWSEAIPPEQAGAVRAEDISRWVVGEYPPGPYPAAMIGSSNGAAVHLCAALGIPWLPQTFLIPVRRSGVHPDEPQADLEATRAPARALLAANPELQLHHMHDANQDRLMIQRMTYFRVKRLRLGATYERFLERTLPAGATLFVLECQLTWPTTRVAERHFFQHGALGGVTPEEYKRGSARVADYLRRYGSHRRRWEYPAADAERPEAEWGFEPALREDIARLARRRGYRVRRIVFEEPEILSALVADLYRWWYRQRRLPANRLLVESFIVMEPRWAVRTGSVPFWMVFNKQPSAERLERYLDSGDPYDEINLMLFSHGVESVGLVPIERWRSILQRARQRGRFIGVDEQAFPRDFATFVRYYTDLKQIPARYPPPAPLALSQLDAFLEEAAGHYPVQWIAPGATEQSGVQPTAD
jgi:hypothetical protein